MSDWQKPCFDAHFSGTGKVEKYHARMIENLDELAAALAAKARETGLKLEGPVSTDLGYGGAPIVTLWSGDRRLHFYFASWEGAVSVMVEVVDRGPSGGARVGRVEDEKAAWTAVESFFRRKKALNQMPDLGWVEEGPLQDQLIPHPPGGPGERVKGAGQLVGSMPKKPAPGAPPSGGIAGLGGIVLFSKDSARLAGWYGERLGLALAPEGDNFHGEIGGLSFGIYAAESPMLAGARAMVTFRVGDFDAFLEGLALKGVDIEGLDRTQRGRFAYVRDVDGNPVELWDGG